MSKEDKQELIEALGGYLPHGVWIDLNGMAGKLNNLYVTHLYNGTDTVQEVDAAIDFCGDGDFINVENSSRSYARCPTLRRRKTRNTTPSTTTP